MKRLYSIVSGEIPDGSGTPKIITTIELTPERAAELNADAIEDGGYIRYEEYADPALARGLTMMNELLALFGGTPV